MWLVEGENASTDVVGPRGPFKSVLALPFEPGSDFEGVCDLILQVAAAAERHGSPELFR